MVLQKTVNAPKIAGPKPGCQQLTHTEVDTKSLDCANDFSVPITQPYELTLEGYLDNTRLEAPNKGPSVGTNGGTSPKLPPWDINVRAHQYPGNIDILQGPCLELGLGL